MIRVSNLSYSIQKIEILKNISLELDKKGIYTLLGPNGAGKTTLIKLLSGVKKPSSGCIELMGRRLESIDRKTLSSAISYMPQNLSPPSLSVYETMLVGLNPYIKLLPSQTLKDRVEKTLVEFDLVALRKRDIRSLSGGELQKVLLAKALIKEPKILFLDEPISHLDPKNQIDSLGLIREYVEKKNILAITVLHDINIAFRFSDYILGLKGGVTEFFKPIDMVIKADLDRTYGLDCEILSVNNKKIVYY